MDAEASAQYSQVSGSLLATGPMLHCPQSPMWANDKSGWITFRESLGRLRVFAERVRKLLDLVLGLY